MSYYCYICDYNFSSGEEIYECPGCKEMIQVSRCDCWHSCNPDFRAFRIILEGYDDGIVFARKASKAKSVAAKSYCEVNVSTMIDAFKKTKVRREPKYDGMDVTHGGKISINFCYQEEYLMEHADED